jgi:type II secretory pathway component PulF
MINADSLEMAKELLRKQKIFVTKLLPYKKERSKFTLSSSLLLHVTRDLYALLRAGLPLYDALLTLEEKYRKHKAHFLFLDLCDQVKQGRDLSFALQSYPKVFDPVYISMVKAGEESGTLEDSFAKLTKLIGQQVSFKKKVGSAMIYPIFLGVFCTIILSGLLFFLIPAMKDLFEDRTLHPITLFVLKISTFLNEHTIFIFSSLFAIILSLILFFRRETGRRLLQKVALRLPLISRLITESVLTRFCRVFSSLLDGGVSMVEALRLSKKAMHSHPFEKAITSAEKKVIEGRRLSEELQKSPLIPNLVIRMQAIGEESGTMAKMMQNVAEIYEEDVERSLTRFVSLLQPAMLLVLGVLVAIILLSVLLPLTDVSSMI